MTPEQLIAITGCKALNAAQYAGPLTAAMKRYGIVTKNQVAGFIGNVAEESGAFSTVQENLFYTTPERLVQVYPSKFPTVAAAVPFLRNSKALAEKVYQGRAGLGNDQPGDGGKYLGRGLIQLTGRYLYAEYSKASGVDAVTNPDLLLQPQNAADSAGWYWKFRGCNQWCDTADWLTLTKKINGGTANHALRMQYINACLRALG